MAAVSMYSQYVSLYISLKYILYIIYLLYTIAEVPYIYYMIIIYMWCVSHLRRGVLASLAPTTAQNIHFFGVKSLYYTSTCSIAGIIEF